METVVYVSIHEFLSTIAGLKQASKFKPQLEAEFYRRCGVELAYYMGKIINRNVIFEQRGDEYVYKWSANNTHTYELRDVLAWKAQKNVPLYQTSKPRPDAILDFLQEVIDNG